MYNGQVWPSFNESAPSGWGNKLNGIAAASIGKVNGVAIASIKNINGVE